MENIATALLFITSLLSLPVVTGAPTSPHLTRDNALSYDCDLAADGLTAGCDMSGHYFTCTNNIVTIFTCTGGCQVLGNGDLPTCDDAVYVEGGTY